MAQNVSSATVVIGTLRVKEFENKRSFSIYLFFQTDKRGTQRLKIDKNCVDSLRPVNNF